MLAVRLDQETEERLEKLAKATHRNKSYYVKRAIKEFLDSQEEVLTTLGEMEKDSKSLSGDDRWKMLLENPPMGEPLSEDERRLLSASKSAKGKNKSLEEIKAEHGR